MTSSIGRLARDATGPLETCNAPAEHQAYASTRLRGTRNSISTPNSVTPKPLAGGLTDPAFELGVDCAESASHVVRLICSARNPKLLDLDPEAAVGADAQTARHPYASTDAARYDGGDRWGERRATEERHRDATLVILVANDPHPTACAHVVHETMCRLKVLQGAGVRSMAPDQPGRAQRLSLGPQIAIDIGIADGSIESRGVGAGDHERPDREFPVPKWRLTPITGPSLS